MKEILRGFSNVPPVRQEDVQWLAASTAIREDKEIVIVKIAPSNFVTTFAEEYVSTLDQFFIGPFAMNRPTIEKNVSFKTNDGEYLYTEEEIIRKYANTILWANIAANKKKYAKTPELKDLLKHIQSQRVCCPVLLINAINCVGPVDVTDKAIRLEVEFIDSWKFEDEILTKKQFVAVSSWFEMLMHHGFDCVEFVKVGAEGNRDFMMMTMDVTEAPSNEETPWDCKFMVKSEKIAANIVGLYRYFFYTQHVKYLSSARRIFQFGNYDATEATMKSMVQTMLKIDTTETFASNTPKQTDLSSSEDSVPSVTE